MRTSRKTPAAFDPGSSEGRVIVGTIIVWGLAWKAASLWTAARNNSKPWFATLLLSNTLGVLDAVYIFGVSRGRKSRERAAGISATRHAVTEHGELDL